MTQPLAVALHALSRVAQAPGRDRSRSSARAGIGSFIVAGASRRAVEGRVVAIDIDDDRLATAVVLWARARPRCRAAATSPSCCSSSATATGFDVVIEASGAPDAPAAAIAGARRGGRVLLVGLHGEPRAIDLTRDDRA